MPLAPLQAVSAVHGPLPTTHLGGAVVEPRVELVNDGAILPDRLEPDVASKVPADHEGGEVDLRGCVFVCVGGGGGGHRITSTNRQPISMGTKQYTSRDRRA